MVIISSYKIVEYFGFALTVPQITNFIAMDEDLKLFAYSEKPILSRNPFEPYTLLYMGEGIYIGTVNEPKMTVKDSLVKV